MSHLAAITLAGLAEGTGGHGGMAPGAVPVGVPAILWACLLLVSAFHWRREGALRERLIVLGCTLGLMGECHIFSPPLELAFSSAAILVIAAVFLQDLLHDLVLARRFLWGSLGVLALGTLVAFWGWGEAHLANPGATFDQTWCGWAFRLIAGLLILFPLVTLWRKTCGWMRDIGCAALALFCISEGLILPGMALGGVDEQVLTPLRQGCEITALVLLGYMYVRESAETRERLEAQLRQAQKMEAIGTLAGGVAHEFKNIIGVLLTYQYLLRHEIREEGPVPYYLQKMGLSLERAKSLAQQVLTFSRLSSTDREPVDLAHIAHEALQFLRASLPEAIEIDERIDETGTVVLADGTQMYQLLINLCSNAEHAMRGRAGRLDIHVEPAVIETAHDSVPVHLAPGDYVRLAVGDTGCGIPSDIQNRIFDPFFTTKVVGEGAGMGLAIVHGIVASHGGGLAVESEVGQGTTFSVYLPRCREAVPDRTEVEEAILVGQGCILLVDDDADMTSGLEMALSNQGYEVLAYTQPAAALAAFDREPRRFDLVITDQSMPGMTGAYLAQAVRKRRSDIPIILCTGFRDGPEASDVMQPEFDAVCRETRAGTGTLQNYPARVIETSRVGAPQDDGGRRAVLGRGVALACRAICTVPDGVQR